MSILLSKKYKNLDANSIDDNYVSINYGGKFFEYNDAKKIYEYYKKVLTNDLVDILVVGEVDSERIREYFTNNFKVNTYKKVKSCWRHHV